MESVDLFSKLGTGTGGVCVGTSPPGRGSPWKNGPLITGGLPLFLI